MSSWSDLPWDILFLIVKKISSASDFLSFSQVCSSWRSIAKQDCKRIRPVLPGILTQKKKNTLSRRFESLSKLNLDLPYKTCLPKLLLPEKNMVCGSHQGWILTQLFSPPRLELTLINPITQVQFKLPFDFLNRITFTANPMDESCYIIATVPVSTMKCYKLGDARWKDFYLNPRRDASFGFVDAIHYRGKLYAVRITGELFVCDDITASTPMMTKLVNTPQYCPVRNSLFGVVQMAQHYSCSRSFLVEAGQELLLVHCQENTNLSAGLVVYRLDLGRLRWDRVTNLGEHALFLGINQSFSLSESDVRGVKGNHIYYIEKKGIVNDGTFRVSDEKDSGKEICVFSLEDSSVEFLTTKFPLDKSLGIWFMPHVGDVISSLAS